MAARLEYREYTRIEYCINAAIDRATYINQANVNVYYVIDLHFQVHPAEQQRSRHSTFHTDTLPSISYSIVYAS